MWSASGDHGQHFCYYPPPTESGRLQTICVRHSGKTPFDPPQMDVGPYAYVPIGFNKTNVCVCMCFTSFSASASLLFASTSSVLRTSSATCRSCSSSYCRFVSACWVRHILKWHVSHIEEKGHFKKCYLANVTTFKLKDTW